MHLVRIHDLIKEFKPTAVVFDPVTNLNEVGSQREVKSMRTSMLRSL